MNESSTLLQQGNAWFFIPSTILLGVLRDLEPGHPKTITTTLIIAIKGTIKQVVTLGLAATLSHAAIAWLVAFDGIYISKAFTAQTVEPWLQSVSAIIILGTVFWMFWRTWQGEQNQLTQTHRDHGHGYHHHHDRDDHHHDHNDDHYRHHHHHHHHHYHEHEHNHSHAALAGPTESSKKYQDIRERAHVTDIQRRFAGKEATSGRILSFGLTGGFIPCPAAITVLLICIQLRVFTLGTTMVLCFDLGLALTLVTVDAEAAISVQQAARRWNGFNTMAHKAPYFFSVFIAMVDLYMGIHGYMGVVD